MNIFIMFLIAILITIFVCYLTIYFISRDDEEEDNVEEKMKINFDRKYIHEITTIVKKENSIKDLEEVFEKIYSAAIEGKFSIYLDYGSLDAAEVKFLRSKGFKVKTVYPVIDYGYISGGYVEVKW